MPDVRSFRAWRYDLGRVGNLSDVIAPPYDVIDPGLQDNLYTRHPNNVVRLILNREEAGDADQHNRYTRAARFLKDWQRDGVLRQDAEPALYVYHQSFKVEGMEFTRRGVLARVRLEKFGAGRIYAHEETMPGPKADRLKLMLATAMNLSPIFGLYPDTTNEIQNLLDDAVRRSLPLEATDHLGTTSRLWPLKESKLVGKVQAAMQERPVFIADGHHRYETSLRYLEERKAAGEVADDEVGADFVLMMLVGMSDPGLLILPTHRLITGAANLNAEQLRGLLAARFDVEVVPSGMEETWKRIEEDGEQSLLGFGTVADGVWQLARFRSPDVMAKLAGQHSADWRGLGVSILHVLVIDKLLREKKECQPGCKYVHLLDEVSQAVAAKQCDLAVLVPPATMQHVEQIAGNLEKMPPKSTYFYPKLLSGLVFNQLR